MTEWLRKHPDSNWEAEERERHALQPAADNSELIGQVQGQTDGRAGIRQTLRLRASADRFARRDRAGVHAGNEFDRLSRLALLKAADGTDDVEHRSAFHGGAASARFGAVALRVIDCQLAQHDDCARSTRQRTRRWRRRLSQSARRAPIGTYPRIGMAGWRARATSIRSSTQERLEHARA